jgi:enediyne biosynthesis protein E4
MCHPPGISEHYVNRRAFPGRRTCLLEPPAAGRGAPPGLGFSLTDITGAAGIDFHHNSGAFGAKYLPETLGPGCAFLDYDNDGWLDILLVNGMDWPGHKRQRSTLKLYRNNRNGTFSDVTERAGLAVEMYGMGVAVADYNNDGLPDILITAVGQSRLFRNTGAAISWTSPKSPASAGAKASARPPCGSISIATACSIC